MSMYSPIGQNSNVVTKLTLDVSFVLFSDMRYLVCMDFIDKCFATEET